MEALKQNRRQFMELAALAGGAALIPAALRADPPQTPVIDAPAPGVKSAGIEVVPWKVQPFRNDQVRLLDGIFKRQEALNLGYMRMLPNDRLAHMFRITAGLPSSAEPLGGWEKPDCQLRGHFSGGHYLSASALMYASTGDEDVKRKAGELVATLSQCQKAHGNGYLSAFPETFFDWLREGKQVWAPFYTIHKIMAGHLDMYTHCGNEQALDTVEKMAGWVGRWVSPLSDDHMQRVLEVEQGGMLEVLCNLYAVTGNRYYLLTAQRFDHHAVFDPLAEYRDELKGLHANTNIPKIIGAARQYEVTGDVRYHNIADYFWHEVTARRVFCSGGTSFREHWLGDAGNLTHEAARDDEECCCGYNMLKLTRHIFGWTAEPAAMDYYERTLFNSRLGTQDPHGLKSYFLPLGRGWWKYYNTPWDSFWCCTGTGLEEFSKFNNTIYFHDERGLYVNLFIASELNWPEMGLQVRQETNFPEQQGTSLVIRAERPVEFTLNIRVPYWVASGGAVKINEVPQPVFAKPGSYLTIHRTWKTGDRVDVSLPMSLRVESLPGDETQQAVMYGPLVLAGRLGAEGLDTANTYLHYNPWPSTGKAAPAPEITAKQTESATWVEAVPGAQLSFRTVGQSQTTALIPLHALHGEHYVVYWKVNSPSTPKTA